MFLIGHWYLLKALISVKEKVAFKVLFVKGFTCISRKSPKIVTPETPKLQEDHYKLVSTPSIGSSPLQSSSSLNTPLGQTPVKKMTFPSEPHHSKDPNSGGSNASSGRSTPRLPYRDLDMLQSISDTESIAPSHSAKKKASSSTIPDLNFLPEVIEGYDDMEEEMNTTKDMLLHLQTLVSCL